MKKVLLLIASATLLFAGCQKEISASKVAEGDFVTCTFVPEMQAVTKGSQDSDGAGANVTRWVFEVLDSDGDVYRREVKENQTGLTNTFEVQLVKGETYDVLFWADAGSYYDIASLRDVKILGAPEYAANLDARDAFSAVVEDFATTQAKQQIVTLYRPFAQVNVQFTDLKKLYDSMNKNMTEYLKYEPVNFEFKATIPGSFNVLEQKAGDAAAFTITAAKDYLLNYKKHTEKETLYMDYLFASKDSKDVVDIAFSFVSKGVTINHNFAAIPFQRNYRTNIIGDFMSSGATFNVVIDPTWIDEMDENIAFTIKSAQDLIDEGKDHVNVDPSAIAASKDQVVEKGGKKYLPLTLGNTASDKLGLTLPPFSDSDKAALGTDTWLIEEGSGCTTDNLDLIGGAGVKVKADLPGTHVDAKGDFDELTAKTADNTLVVCEDATVKILVIEKGALKIFGDVTSASVNVSGTDKVYVRDCIGLSQEVYTSLSAYIDVANGYGAVQDGDKWNIEQGAAPYVATIGTTGYYTIAAAFAAVQDNETINVNMSCQTGADFTMANVLAMKASNVTIDLGGNTLTTTNNMSCFIAGENAIVKNGKIYAGDNSDKESGYNSYAINVASKTQGTSVTGVKFQDVEFKGGVSFGGSIGNTEYEGSGVGTLENCTITTGDFSAIYAQAGASSATVLSGNYIQTAISAGNTYIFGTTSGSSVLLKGGTYNTDPTQWVAEDYKVTKSGNVWTVSPVDPVAKIGEKTYTTLEKAFAAAADGDEIELLCSCTLSASQSINKSLTLNLKNFTLTAACSGYAFDINTTADGKTFKIKGTDSGNCGHIVSNGTSGHSGVVCINANSKTANVEMNAVKVHGAAEADNYIASSVIVSDNNEGREDKITLTNVSIRANQDLVSGSAGRAYASIDVKGGTYYSTQRGFRFCGTEKSASVIDDVNITTLNGISVYAFSPATLKNSTIDMTATGNNDAVACSGYYYSTALLTVSNTTVEAKGTAASAVAAESLGNVTVESGEFSNANTGRPVIKVSTSSGTLNFNGGTILAKSDNQVTVFTNTQAQSSPDPDAAININGGTIYGSADVSSDNAFVNIYAGTFKSAFSLIYRNGGGQYVKLAAVNTAVFESTLNNENNQEIAAGTFKGAVTTGEKTLKGGTYYVQPTAAQCVTGYVVSEQSTTPPTWKVIEIPETEISSASQLAAIASQSGKYKLTNNITLSSKIEFSASSLSLNMNGKTISCGSINTPVVVKDGADITIKNGKLTSSCTSDCVVSTKGVVTLSEMEIKNGIYAVAVEENGKANIESGDYSNNRSATAADKYYQTAAISVSSAGVAKISGGTFTGTYYACAINSSGGTINITGGTFNKGAVQSAASEGNLAYAFLNDGNNTTAKTGRITISGNPVIHGSFRGRFNNQAGHYGYITITGGTFDSDCELFNFNQSYITLGAGYSITANGECPDKGYSKTTGNGKRWKLVQNQ